MIYDVVVVGAGPAGLVAATQAARAGAKVLLVEKSGLIGGTTVLNGVNLPGLFHAWGRQVIAGIGWELIESVVKADRQELPPFEGYARLPHYKLQVSVNCASYAALADQMVCRSGADILLHTLVAELSFDDVRGLWDLSLCGKEGLFPIKASKLVDCTGDANLVGLAGYGRFKDEVMQPGTLVMRVSGYDEADLDYDALEEAFLQEVEAGRMRRTDLYPLKSPVRSFLKMRGSNSIHVTGIDASTSRGKTEAELKARAIMLRIQTFMRSQPGLAHFQIDHFSPECGIRESYRIDGEICISAKDYCMGKVWPDSYCYSFYPIDMHASDGGGIDTRPLQEGTFPTIPLRAMIPKGSAHLLVAGRCASGDRTANSAFRVQASCMATGQVAGAVAALAAQSQTDLQSVPKVDIVDLLCEHGAIVPGSKLEKSV